DVAAAVAWYFTGRPYRATCPRGKSPRRARLPDDGDGPLFLQVRERVLHLAGHALVDLLVIGVRAKAVRDGDRREDLNRDLGRERKARRHIEQADPEWRRERDRQHLDPRQVGPAGRLRRTLSTRQEQRGLLA